VSHNEPLHVGVRRAGEFQEGPGVAQPLPLPQVPRHYELGPSELPYRAYFDNPPGPDDWIGVSVINVPDQFAPWWEESVTQPMRRSSPHRVVGLDGLIVEALQSSPRIRAIGEQGVIAETLIMEAEAEFDVHSFIESKFVRTSDPVGNLLTTGGPPRLRESDFAVSAGLRRKGETGGSLELAQKIGTLDSNSLFFDPLHQGNARLALSYTHPLLNGAGRVYNTSLIMLADIDTAIALDQTSQELQDHLLLVSRAYWQLYLRRAALLQRQRHYQRAEAILDHLEHRRSIDALRSQIVRAQAAVATRRAELVRAAADIRNAEAEVRALVQSAELTANPYIELVPREDPSMVQVPVDLRDSMLTALRHRPEIDQAIQRVRAAGVRLDMSKNQLLPVLDVVLETYVSGLQGEYDIGESLIDQFSVGEPGYTAGLVYEVPLGRRAAKARFERRRLELQQLSATFEDAVQSLLSEVEVAVRDVDTSYRELQGKYQALVAQETEVEYYQRRWEMLPGEDIAASFMLEDLLDAQDRLATEEFEFARAQFTYMISVIQLKRATGTLLQFDKLPPIPASPAPPAEALLVPPTR
jgi:outer membrane protein TolC